MSVDQVAVCFVARQAHPLETIKAGDTLTPTKIGVTHRLTYYFMTFRTTNLQASIGLPFKYLSIRTFDDSNNFTIIANACFGNNSSRHCLSHPHWY